jgi:hypothetical protein
MLRLGGWKGIRFESNPTFYKQAAQLVNDATGRGHMGMKAKMFANVANGILYSARLNISRIQLLNDLLNPIKYLPERVLPELTTGPFSRWDPAMRKVVAGELVRAAVGMTAVYGTARLAGFSVTLNPDSPDFGKLRHGNMVFDPTGGNALPSLPLPYD